MINGSFVLYCHFNECEYLFAVYPICAHSRELFVRVLMYEGLLFCVCRHPFLLSQHTKRSHHSISYLITSVEMVKITKAKCYKIVHMVEALFFVFHCDCLPNTHTRHTSRESDLQLYYSVQYCTHTHTHCAYNVHMIASLRPDTHSYTHGFSILQACEEFF